MNLVKYFIPTLVLLMLGGCAGAHITVPLGPITIGTDISMFGDSSSDNFDETVPDESRDQDERE